MGDRVVYVGKDLEAMGFAENYHRWILREFQGHIGEHVVEVGAGTGSFSRLIAECGPKRLSLVEPSGMYDQLVDALPSRDGQEVRYYNSTFRDAAPSIASERPDTIVYVNVLEHIEDDTAELAAVYETLARGGKCLIFVPALMALYGAFDKKVGHFRRYSRREIKDKCRSAGFRSLDVKFFDLFGVVPWWVKYRLLRSDELDARSVKTYDKLVVPVASKIESTLPVPIGKNLLAIATK